MKDRFEKVASYEDYEGEEFEDYHTNFDEHDDPNLWVGKRVNRAMNQA